jgi:predicted nucleic acid-binding protein
MKLVLNANVIFSALLRGKPLSLFIKLEDKGIELITPNFLIEEFLKRRKELANALGISETKLLEAFSKLISKLVRVLLIL